MVIRMRHTRAHTRNRRSHHALKEATITVCAHCGAGARPHHMCLSCGYYKGRQVLDLGTLKAKRDARIATKRDRIKLESGTGNAPASEHEDHKHEHAEEEHKEEVKAKEVTKKSPKTRATKTGSSSKKEKQESS